MRLEYNEKIIGYHGATKSNIEEILNGNFEFKQRNDHWLGQGIYLYNNIELAKWWIDTKIKRLGINDKGGIIKVTTYRGLRKLDLDNNKHIDFFKEKTYECIKELESQGLKFNFGKTPSEIIKNRCFALDLLKRKYEIDVIEKTFEKNNPRYAGYQKNIIDFGINYKEKQICISRNENIEEKKCVYEFIVDEYITMKEKIKVIRKGDL